MLESDAAMVAPLRVAAVQMTSSRRPGAQHRRAPASSWGAPPRPARAWSCCPRSGPTSTVRGRARAPRTLDGPSVAAAAAAGRASSASRSSPGASSRTPRGGPGLQHERPGAAGRRRVATSTASCTCSTSTWAGSPTASRPPRRRAPRSWSREALGRRIGMSVCYDLRFPELYRRLAIRGRRGDRGAVGVHGRHRPGPLGAAPARPRHREPGVRDRREPVRRPRRRHGLARAEHDRRPLGGRAGRRRPTARASRWPTSTSTAWRPCGRACPPWSTAGPTSTARWTRRASATSPGRQVARQGGVGVGHAAADQGEPRDEPRVEHDEVGGPAGGERRAAAPAGAAGPRRRPRGRRRAGCRRRRASRGPRRGPAALPARRPPARGAHAVGGDLAPAEPVAAGRRAGGGRGVAHQHQPPARGPGERPPRPPGATCTPSPISDTRAPAIEQEGGERRGRRGSRCRASR